MSGSPNEPRNGHDPDLATATSRTSCSLKAADLGTARIQRGLRDAVIATRLTAVDGKPLRVVAHQLRHTWATELANAGMSLQALMTLLGHRSPVRTSSLWMSFGGGATIRRPPLAV